MTLIDEDNKLILTDNANKEIPSNMTLTMHVVKTLVKGLVEDLFEDIADV